MLLRKRITIRRLTFAKDNDGWSRDSSSWADLTTVWGQAIPSSGTDRMKADQFELRNPQTVWLRCPIEYGSPLVEITPTTTDSIRFDGRTMPIRSVERDVEGKVHYWKLICDEGEDEFPG